MHRSTACLRSLSALVLAILLTASAEAQSTGRWTRIGPDGGSVTALAAAPSQPGTVYAGLSGGGVFRSTNGGRTWTFAGAGLGRAPSVTGLAVDAAQPGTVYAGTQNGLFRSTNGGVSWARVRLPAGTALSTTVVAADPRRSGIVYAGPSDGGLLASADRGRTWKTLSFPQDDGTLSLAIDPESPNTLYAGTFISGAFKSTDAGAHWKLVTGGIQPAVTRVAALAIDPRRPQTIYLSATGDGVYRSTDGGGHWAKVSTGIPPEADVRAVAVDPGSSTVFAGTAHDGVFRSSDGGLHWRPAGGLPDPAVNVLTAAASGLFVGSPSGLLVSHDRAQTWQAGRGIRGLSITSLAIDSQDPPRLYAFDGTRLFKSASRGAAWTRLPLPTGAFMPSGPVAVHPDDPQHVELGAVSRIEHSNDGGHGWADHFDARCIIPDQILVDPSDPDVVYTLGGLLPGGCGSGPSCFTYKFDHGQVSCLSDPAIDPEGVHLLAIDPASPGHLFAGIDKLYQSTDAGATWSMLSTALQPFVLLVDPVRSGRLYAASLLSGVMRSVDGGVTWQTSTGLPTKAPVLSLAIDPTHPSTLYASTAAAVYRSTDSGVTWAQLGTGLEEVTVVEIVIDPQDPEILYAATYGGGVMMFKVEV